MGEPLILAGGGTGGHVFPLVAIAEALIELRPSVEPIFVGTARGMEARFVPERGYRLELMDVLPMRGAGIRGLLRGSLRAFRLLPDSLELLEATRALGVLSIGGYAAGPVSLAARLKGLPLALLEPNSRLGLANWLTAPWVDRAYTAFPVTESAFSPEKVRMLGVPLRAGFAAVPPRRERGPVRVLILGGSQGATALNDRVPEALSSFQGEVAVIHQAGEKHCERVSEKYASLGMNDAKVLPFVFDMPAALADADLVISRSGASAVSEIAAVGRPSILIPYPHASADHQRHNAMALAQQGAAICIPQSGATLEALRGALGSLVRDRGYREKMAACARNAGRPRAALRVAADFLALLGLSH